MGNMGPGGSPYPQQQPASIQPSVRRAGSPMRQQPHMSASPLQQPAPAMSQHQSQMQHVPPPLPGGRGSQSFAPDPRQSLEVSQRMSRANELQHRLGGSGHRPAPSSFAPPVAQNFNFNTPGLFPFSRDQP